MRNIYTSENYTLAYHVSMYTEREYTGRPPSALYLVYFYIGPRGDLPPPLFKLLETRKYMYIGTHVQTYIMAFFVLCMYSVPGVLCMYIHVGV